MTVERARSWSGVAEESGRELQVMTAAAPVAVRASREDVEAVIDALVGNVFAHTPDGTPMWILAEPTEGGGRLIVEDAGPGFNDVDLLAQRRTGGIPAGSTGSGLAVSRRVAESSGGELTLAGRRGGGAQVVVDLG